MDCKNNQPSSAVKHAYRLIFLFPAFLCLLHLTGCGQGDTISPPSGNISAISSESAPESTILEISQGTVKSVSEESSKSAAEDIDLPKLPLEQLAKIAEDTHMTLGVAASITRDDLGVTAKSIAPFRYKNIAQSLLDMDLRPFAASGKRLDVPKPFTVHMKFGGWEESFSFTSEKITVGGVDYFPANPAALRQIYDRDEHYGLLTEDIYYLRRDWDFNASDVKEVKLLAMSPMDETTLTLTGKKEIEAVVDALGGYVVRPLASGEMEDPKTGGANTCTITLLDGTVWVYSDVLPALQKNGEKKASYVEISTDFSGVFGLVWDFDAVPGLSAKIGTVEPKIYVNTFDYAGNKKVRSSPVPADMDFDADSVLPPGQSAACVLSFTDSNAQAVVPSAVSVMLYREKNQQINPTGEKLEIDNQSVVLPTLDGKYYVGIEAKFPDGGVNYMFEYRVTNMPAYFDDIAYGNNANDVTVVRDDAGVSISVTGQNRKFVNFIRSLELKPAVNAQGAQLPVQKPFTMRFTNGNTADTFQFAQNGITYNGEAYATPFPERIEELYEKVTGANFTPQEPGSVNNVKPAEELIDYTLRGFLTKEVVRLPDAYPIIIPDIQKLVVVREMPDNFTRFDVTSSLQGKTGWLENIVLAKNWRESDYYFPRRSFYSFEITMKDGTVYVVGEKLLVNGKDSGWYIVQSDSEEAAALTDGIAGEEVEREKRLPGGIMVDDNGVITFD